MKHRSYIAGLICAASAIAAHAAPIEAVGVAPLDHGVEYARQAAREDAMQQLALQRGAVVLSSEQMTARGDILQSSSVRAATQPGKVATLREWTSGGHFHILIQADDSERTGRVPIAPYRKKVLITPFRVVRREQVIDMDDVIYGIPRNLYERLAPTGKLQPRVGSYALPVELAGTSQNQFAAAVRQLAIDNDSQFVLTGEVTDAGISASASFFESKTTRNFEVRTALYDGLTGVLLAERRVGQQGEGEVTIGRSRPFGSASFFSTPFGKVIDSVLGSIAVETIQDLAPLPFTARIVRIENTRVIFDAGATSAVQPGDSLIVYSRKTEWDVSEAMNGAGGVPESPVATMSVLQVHPTFSVGEVFDQSTQVRLKVGDYVRFASSYQ